jgi:hypothetical protein
MSNNTIFTALFLLSLFGCKSDHLDVDISSIKVGIEVKRMEQELFQTESNNTNEKHSQLLEKYGSLYQLFFENMLGEGSVHDPMASTYLEQFIGNKDMQTFYLEIDTKFNDFSAYETDFVDAFKHYKYYFPDSTIPTIVTFYSNFNANAFPIGKQLGIGLDMYLGTENEIVKSIPTASLPQFIKDKMDSKFLVADGLKYWLYNRFFEEDNQDFLAEIISSGKIMYLMDALLPNKSDAIKMGYTEEELTWCEKSEVQIWEILINEELLYSKDQKKIAQFTTNGPFTKGLPEESPSMVGIWIGWQMVKDYVEDNGASVLDLLAETNHRKILKSYNPNE